MTAAIADKPAAAPALSLTERFCARLDQHLETMAPSERLPFLLDQRTEWIAQFDRFTRRVEDGERPHWGETAWDYALTITELSKRIAEQQP